MPCQPQKCSLHIQPYPHKPSWDASHLVVCIRETYSRTSVAVCTDNGITLRSVINNTPLGLPLEIPLLYQYTTSKHDVPSGWDTPESTSNAWQHSQLCTKDGAAGRKGGAPLTGQNVQQGTRFIQTADTKIKEVPQAAKRKKDRLFGLLFALKMKENKSTPMHYCPREEHCQSCKPVYNHFDNMQVTRTPVLRGLGLDFLPSINKGNVNCSICWLTMQGSQTEWFLGIRSKQKIPLVPKNQNGLAGAASMSFYR